VKIFLVLSIFLSLLSAKEIEAVYKFKASGFVNDFFISKNKLYIATDAGILDIYSLESKKLIDQVVLEPLISAQGVVIDAHILSVDMINDKVLFVSTTLSGYRNVWLYTAHKLRLIVDENREIAVKEARFIDGEKVMFSTLGAEMILHDIGESYSLYTKQISGSSLGDYQLSKDKKTIALADESGAVRIMSVAEAKLLAEPKPQNLDNIFHIAYANGSVLTAGQDRRVGVYPKGISSYYIKTNFLVYCVGLSPSARIGVYTKGEENVLQLFSPHTKQNLDTLVGHKGIVNQIKFTSENEFYSSDRSRYIYFWRF